LYDRGVRAVCAIVALLACQSRPAPLQQVTVAELLSHRGEHVQVTGVVEGAHRVDADVELVLVDHGARVTVRARPPLPDLFRDGVEVKVRGTLAGGTLAGDTLVADEVLTIPQL
jgi:cytochrome c-type biogenesis protein CcmE